MSKALDHETTVAVERRRAVRSDWTPLPEAGQHDPDPTAPRGVRGPAAEREEHAARAHLRLLEETSQRLDEFSAALKRFSEQLSLLTGTLRASTKAHEASQHAARRYSRSVALFTLLLVFAAVTLFQIARESYDPFAPAVTAPEPPPVSPAAAGVSADAPPAQPAAPDGQAPAASATASAPVERDQPAEVATPAQEAAEAVTPTITPEYLSEVVEQPAAEAPVEASPDEPQAAPEPEDLSSRELQTEPPGASSEAAPDDPAMEQAALAFGLMEAALREASEAMSRPPAPPAPALRRNLRGAREATRAGS